MNTTSIKRWQIRPLEELTHSEIPFDVFSLIKQYQCYNIRWVRNFYSRDQPYTLTFSCSEEETVNISQSLPVGLQVVPKVDEEISDAYNDVNDIELGLSQISGQKKLISLLSSTVDAYFNNNSFSRKIPSYLLVGNHSLKTIATGIWLAYGITDVRYGVGATMGMADSLEHFFSGGADTCYYIECANEQVSVYFQHFIIKLLRDGIMQTHNVFNRTSNEVEWERGLVIVSLTNPKTILASLRRLFNFVGVVEPYTKTDLLLALKNRVAMLDWYLENGVLEYIASKCATPGQCMAVLQLAYTFSRAKGNEVISSLDAVKAM